MMRALNAVRCFAADILYAFCGTPLKSIIDMDIERNLKWDKNKYKMKGKVKRLNYLLLNVREFRNIFYFRERHHQFLCRISRFFLPDIKTVEIGGRGEFDGGLMISHYHSVICPKNAGKNLRVGPGAVIGRNGGDFPLLVIMCI